MLFERFVDPDLSHFSYAVGCPGAGEIAIVDPRRDIDVYLDFAVAHDVEITAVLETHIHADFASGARELAQRTGATHHVSAHDSSQAGDEEYVVQFDHSDLSDGESVTLGNVRLVARHTPGHTPEHLSFVVFDGARSTDTPIAMLSGDFLFVGSLGRPDLLGEEAKRDLARQLYASVRALDDLPDGLEIHPGHGAGSLCGSGMSAREQSTLGFERATNRYLDPDLDEETFVERILGSVPVFPPYYRRMKRINSEGPELLDGLPGLEPLSLEAFRDVLGGSTAFEGDVIVLDLRDHTAFGGAHVPGAFGIGAGSNLSTWSAWMVPYDQPILLVADASGGAGDDRTEALVEDAVRSLVRVGHDAVRGWLDGGFAAWRGQGLPSSALPQLAPGDLRERLDRDDSPFVVDVRTADEFAGGHVPGAHHRHAGQLAEHLDEIPRDRSVVAICGSGYRSTAAASLLQRAGFDEVAHVTGGMSAWEAADLPTESESTEDGES